MDLNKEPLILNEDFNYVLDLLENTSDSVFITGRAGTGKSTLLQLFRKNTRKNAVVVAPTGVAALNVGGQTIHSFFGFPARYLDRDRDIRKRRSRKIYEKMEVLVIDEISMVRADLLDAIDYFLRRNRENPWPFGGVQVVFVGDLFQLPPVVSSQEERLIFETEYDSPYFFSSKVFQEGFEMETVELTQAYRQQSVHFLRLLNAVRLNQLDYDDLEDLNERYLPQFEPEEYYLTLTARNASAQQINRSELNRIQAPQLSFTARVTGAFSPHLYPTDLTLNLKEGAQVMFVKNDPQRKFVNGTIGKVVALKEREIKVRVEERGKPPKVIDVQPLTWELLKYKLNEDTMKVETEVVGTFEQIPLKLAWAITIHKSQGKTFDRVIIELGRGAFEHGQTYVALSRCRTLEGIVLKKALRPRDIMVDERIVEFCEQCRR